jgi:hypothetical protein
MECDGLQHARRPKSSTRVAQRASFSLSALNDDFQDVIKH